MSSRIERNLSCLKVLGPCERKRSVKSARDRRENADEREREKGRVWVWCAVG